MSTSSNDDDDDDRFLRVHAKDIAQALQERETQPPKKKESLIHDTYVALCYDDPTVESDQACQFLASALLDPQSSYALSGPLVEGIRQLCSKMSDSSGNDTTSQKSTSNNQTEQEESLLPPASSALTAKGCAILAWTVYARIPLLCCQASAISEAEGYLGSYRPPEPATPAVDNDNDNQQKEQQQQQDEADRVVANMLRQQSLKETQLMEEEESKGQGVYEEEVWAAESDPSDFEYESGLDYQRQMEELKDFSAWMVDRTNPTQLSKPPATTTWKHVRHAVMDLVSQLSYRNVAPVVSSPGLPSPSDLLLQLTLTLLLPPNDDNTNKQRPSLFDCPDDERDFDRPHQRLQAIAWHPLWVLRDAAAARPDAVPPLAQYLALLQTLLAVDAASEPTSSSSLAPATYVGLASLSALCQQVVVDSYHHHSVESHTPATVSRRVERFRELRKVLWESCDELTHVLEKEGSLLASAQTTPSSDTNEKNGGWIVWTMLPIWEVLFNVSLQKGTCLVAKADGVAVAFQRQQQWSALLQSGLLRQWLLRLDALRRSDQDNQSLQLLRSLVRRSLLFLLAQSTVASSVLAKYAWRFPSFGELVQIRTEPTRGDEEGDPKPSSTDPVDDLLWNLLAMELAGTNPAAPAVQWKSGSKLGKLPSHRLPTRQECQEIAWSGFQKLCDEVVQAIELACKEENKKENELTVTTPTDDGSLSSDQYKLGSKLSESEDQERQFQEQQLAMQNFHRLVDCLVSCPLLAKLFVHDMPETGEGSAPRSIPKCLDAIQEILLQYKAPQASHGSVKEGVPHTEKKSHKDNDDFEGDYSESSRSQRLDPSKAQAASSGLQEDIHSVRKVLKMLRSLLSTPATTSALSTAALNVASSAKTD